MSEKNYQEGILRFATIGSVDDGKSTLIGRLLYETKSVFEDQLQALDKENLKLGEELNLALLTDGLKAEREQGITIDVAYRYFATPKRKFIIADCPGHIEYTRNMVTGCSQVNLALLLVDARHGVVEQTKRHTFIASLMQIKHLVICVNKMDLVDYQESVFQDIKKQIREFTSRLDIPDIQVIPISALKGENITTKSANMPWFEGASLLYTLENTMVTSDANFVEARFPVQTVIRPQSAEHPDFRGYAGKVVGGVFKPGDQIQALPSGFSSTVKEIFVGDSPVSEAFFPMSVCMTLKDDIDLSRGDMIVKLNNTPEVTQDLSLMICWLNKKALDPTVRYQIMHTTKEVQCKVQEVSYKINIHNLRKIEDDKNIMINDIARINVRTSQPLFVDHYQKNKETGSLILIDPRTCETVAAALVL